MIIAFGHKARHGKDTAGEAIVEHLNDNISIAVAHGIYNNKVSSDKYFPPARIFKFAEELYKVCRKEYGMVGKDSKLLQAVGDGRRNEFGADYWIRRLEPQLLNFKGVAVITDMRYINEAEFVKSLGGFTVNVTRLNPDGTLYQTDDRDPNFISEVQLDNYNYDFYIKAKTGDAALVSDQAITLLEYLRGLEK